MKSSAQDETVFSSERLTLISLDHLYTFRAALQTYARTKAPCCLEDAVDELRRLFLSNGRRALRKSALLAAYRWLEPISDAALTDVCRMYERAYGGVEKEGGIENDVDGVPSWPLAEKEEVEESGYLKSKRMGMAMPGDGGFESSLPESPVLEEWADPLEKEIMLAINDLTTDEQSEIDEIEAWYRDVHHEPEATEADPLPSGHTEDATTTINTSKEASLPRPLCLRSSLPPPPPTSPKPPFSVLSADWARPTEAELGELRRTTPKLRPAPPGRSLALKLQTTFDKPVAKKPCTTKSQTEGGKKGETAQPQSPKQGDEDEEEEELTARPTSAIKSFANARWTTSSNSVMLGNGGNGVSIDEMLHGGGQQQQQEGDDRVGPMTPNGYDDISPITRGEWGFLMFGKSGRTAKVEMC